MTRREFITLLGGAAKDMEKTMRGFTLLLLVALLGAAAAAWPFAVRAQQASQTSGQSNPAVGR